MTEFGPRLRRERERRHIALSSIAANTKINASLFEALERDDVSRWPAGIFRRSFVRAYAEAIGLDADETLQEFLERFPEPSDAPPDTRPAAVRSGRGSAPVLRLTLAEPGDRFLGGTLMRRMRSRLAAVAWDAGSLVALGTSAFVMLGSFWMPLAVSALCYYVGGILLLGNTPGVCLFAPKGPDQGDEGPAPGDQPELNFPLSNEFQHL
jgi:hypothetical protein